VARTIAITWLDLIIAALLIVCGIGIWSATENAVSYALRDNAPNKQEFLARESVRTTELKLKNAQEELDATRKKWIEQRLAGVTPDRLGPQIHGLETAQLMAENKVALARRQSTREFEQQALLFLVKKRLLTLLMGVIAAALGFLVVQVIGSIAARSLQLTPKWRAAMSVASVVLAPLFGYQTAGLAGAAAAGIAVSIILVSFR
jgi:hypothetical protein